MLSKKSSDIFQEHMPGNICFGCGKDTKNGLHIQSYWNDKKAECVWTPGNNHQGWPNILNGGIIATIIDCHCMATAMAYAYGNEGRNLDSKPVYKYATGTIKVKYIFPTPHGKVKLLSQVDSYAEKKVFVTCDLYSGDKKTASAEVIAFRVYDSSKLDKNDFAP